MMYARECSSNLTGKQGHHDMYIFIISFYKLYKHSVYLCIYNIFIFYHNLISTNKVKKTCRCVVKYQAKKKSGSKGRMEWGKRLVIEDRDVKLKKRMLVKYCTLIFHTITSCCNGNKLYKDDRLFKVINRSSIFWCLKANQRGWTSTIMQS